MQKLIDIATDLKKEGIDCYYVGGCVRDQLMGYPVDDIDICLTGVSNVFIVRTILMKHCKDIVGVHGKFPIWICKIDKKKIDFAIARTEKLVGDKRTDVEVDISGVTIEEDLKRRDLTINAIARNILTGELIDPYKGQKDIEMRIAHPVSDAFSEDTLRVIRAARFCSKFSLVASKRLLELCRSLKPTDISNERVGMELYKVLKDSAKPSVFFEMLDKFGWLGYYFQELKDLQGVPQSLTRHPEGDAYYHTLYTIDAAKNWFTRTVMLCHDLGKATHTQINGEPFVPSMEIHLTDDIKISSIGHEEASVELARRMLKRIVFSSKKVVHQMLTLVRLHMIRMNVSEKVVRRTLRQLDAVGLEYKDLVEVCRCDVSGRPPLQPYTPDIGQELAKALMLDKVLVPIVTGQRLIDEGYKPSKEFGQITDKALELQDRGTLGEHNWKSVLKGCGFETFKTPKSIQD